MTWVRYDVAANHGHRANISDASRPTLLAKDVGTFGCTLPSRHTRNLPAVLMNSNAATPAQRELALLSVMVIMGSAGRLNAPSTWPAAWPLSSDT